MGKRGRQRRRWRWLVGATVVGLVLGLFVVMAIRAAYDEPLLVISPEAKDIGEIGRLQGSVRADFQVENRGTGSLHIRRIVTS